MTASRWVPLLLLLTAAAAAVGWLLQRAHTRVLHEEIALLKADVAQLDAARAENARLRAAQPSADEIRALQADNAALQRLRRELAALRESIRAAEAGVAADAVAGAKR